VAENLIFSDKEAAFLKELVKQKVQFMIVGLSAAALQGAPVVTQDVDLWFKDLSDPGIKKALKKVGGAFVPPIGLNPPMFAGKSVQLFDIVTVMHGLDSFDEEIENTIELSIGKFSLKAINLSRIIKSKEAVGREKDRLALPVLRDALATIEEISKQRKKSHPLKS
jgi:hypothetical protein